MVKSKPSRPPKGNVLKIPSKRKKGQASNPNKYRSKKPQNKPSPYPKADTDFQGHCTGLEGYTFDLGPIAPDKFSRTMRELEQYLEVTYSDRCQPYIMTETH